MNINTWMEWALIAETIIVFILLVLIFKKHKSNIKTFIAWVRPSAEGENKTASGRRLTAFAITLICYIGGTVVFYKHGTEQNIDPNFFILKFLLDIVFIGLLWGFINQQTIVALKNGGGFFQPPPPTTTTTTTTTTKNEDLNKLEKDISDPEDKP